MNHDILKPVQKEIYSSKPVKVFYVIQRFPHFDGYTGGGAERHLERLIQTTQEKFDRSFKPQLYVANRQLEESPLEVPIIADPERTKLLDELEAINAPDQILHLSDSYVMLYHPEIYAEILKFWEGPIIQRVTLVSRLQELSHKYREAFQNYIAPISKFISQSPEMTAELIELGVSPEKIFEVENGVDTEFFKPVNTEIKQKLRTKLFPELDPEAKIYMSIARLTDPVKKIDLLIEQWKKSMKGQNAHLLLVGGFRPEETSPDSLVSQLYQSATRWKTDEDGIIFTGTEPSETIKELLQMSDAFLLPSIREGFSNVALEAMSSGLPILVREGVSGFGKLIIDKKTGLLFQEDEDLGDGILELHNNEPLRKELVIGARDHIIKFFSIEAVIEKYRKLYISEINNKR